MKKMLVPFDEKNPGKRISDFIYPELDEAGVAFVGIKKSKKWKQGMIVYTGVEITANEILTKITNTGKSIKSVESMTENLQQYVSQLSEFSIGNILEVEKDETLGFKLKKIKDRAQLIGECKIP